MDYSTEVDYTVPVCSSLSSCARKKRDNAESVQHQRARAYRYYSRIRKQQNQRDLRGERGHAHTISKESHANQSQTSD